MSADLHSQDSEYPKLALCGLRRGKRKIFFSERFAYVSCKQCRIEIRSSFLASIRSMESAQQEAHDSIRVLQKEYAQLWPN